MKKHLNYLILSTLALGIMPGIVQAEVIPDSATTVGGIYDYSTATQPENWIVPDTNQNLTALDDVTFKTSPKFEDQATRKQTSMISSGSDNTTLNIDMAGHNFTVGKYGPLLFRYAKKSTTAITNADTITAEGQSANIIVVNNASIAKLEAKNNINLKNSNTNPNTPPNVRADNNSQIIFKAGKAISLTASSNVIYLGTQSIANLSAGGTILLKQLSVTYPTFYIDNGDLTLTGNDIELHSNSRVNLLSFNHSKINITAAKDITSTSVSSTKAGSDFFIENSTNEVKAGGNITRSSDAKMTTVSKGGTLTETAGGDIKLHSLNNDGVKVTDTGSKYMLTSESGKVYIISDTDSGIIAQMEGQVTLASDTVITAPSDGINASSNGQVMALQGLDITTSSTALNASSGGKIYAQNPDATIALKNALIADGGEIYVTLGNGTSFLNGYTKVSNTNNVDGSTSMGRIDLAVNDGAIWSMTQDSSLTNLNNTNLVDMTASGVKGDTLTTKTLTGSGNIKMNLNWLSNQKAKAATDASDYITVTDQTASGVTGSIQALTLDADELHLDSMGITDRLYFSTVKGSPTDLSYTSPITKLNHYRGHLYDYWFGINHTTNGDTTDWYFGTIGRQENAAIDANLKGNRALINLATDMDRLNKRLGEARFFTDDKQGLWARTNYTTGSIDGIDGHQNMVQMGQNNPVKREDGSIVHHGIALDYTRATVAYGVGQGHVKRHGVTAYNTWMGTKGHYLDVVGRLGRVSASLNNQEDSKISTGTWLQSLSAEYGRHIDKPNKWFLEPQSQLQYTHLNKDSYQTSDGISVHQDDVHSLILRLGFRLGQKINAGSQWYFKADWMHEFNGKSNTSLTSIDGLENITRGVRGHKTWGDIGFGISHTTAHDGSYWFDIERKIGNGVSRAWEFNLGASWKV